MIDWRTLPRLVLAVLLTLSAVLVPAPAQAASERSLYLYYTHTRETARIVFKRDGRYVQSGLSELNQFLRDWRRNEPAQMDPRLFDLIWEVYQEVGATQPVNIVSAYRSPQTNAMLARNSSAVADNSQHMRGTAMDFFIPGVPLARLRATAMKKQVGGVGYYPNSGSPFVHLDTGSVRAWPRMTRAQLREVFPDGRTMHLPSDGSPLSQEGYQLAQADWQRCHASPCGGNSSSGTQVAGSGRSLVDMIFGGGGNQSQPAAAPAPSAPAPAAPVQATIQTAAAPAASRVAPVMPTLRPADLGGPAPVVQVAEAAAIPFSTTGSAPLEADEVTETLVAVAMPVTMPEDLRTMATEPRSGNAVTALAALTAPTMPTPRVIMSEPPADILNAYLPSQTAEPGAQRALEAIISQSTTASTVVTAAAPANPARLPDLPVLTASNGVAASLGAGTLRPGNGLFEQTFGAAATSGANPLAEALAAHVAGRSDAEGEADMRRPDLIAPDLDHAADVFMAPSALASDHFAVIFDRDEADFDPTTEMGRHVPVKGVGDAGPARLSDRFAPVSPSLN